MLKATSSIVNVSQITGVLPVVNGGTGVTTSTGTGSTVLSAEPTLSGNVTLSTGNLIVASGQGIDFSATPGTGTSELLNDYEEGTWTPTITAGVGSFTSFTSQGIYTKVGRIVTAYCSFQITDVGTGTVFCTIAGYPFTSNNTAAPSDQASVALYRNSTTGATGGTSLGKNGTSGTLFATFVTNDLFEFIMVYQTA